MESVNWFNLLHTAGGGNVPVKVTSSQPHTSACLTCVLAGWLTAEVDRMGARLFMATNWLSVSSTIICNSQKFYTAQRTKSCSSPTGPKTAFLNFTSLEAGSHFLVTCQNALHASMPSSGNQRMATPASGFSCTMAFSAETLLTVPHPNTSPI